MAGIMIFVVGASTALLLAYLGRFMRARENEPRWLTTAGCMALIFVSLFAALVFVHSLTRLPD